jgi:hypothetical protein
VDYSHLLLLVPDKKIVRAIGKSTLGRKLLGSEKKKPRNVKAMADETIDWGRKGGGVMAKRRGGD